MKHTVAVAVLSGMADALAQEVENGNITVEVAKQAQQFALSIARERLKGNRVFLKKLEDFSQYGEQLQSIIDGEKIKLQKWGD